MIIYDLTVMDWRACQPEFATLDEAKAYACNEIEKAAAVMRENLLNPISPFEASSWPIKQAEAVKVITGGESAIIDAEATARGITAEQLADKIMSKATQLAFLEAQIAGASGKHRDAINALTTIEEVQNYHPGEGWPV